MDSHLDSDLPTLIDRNDHWNVLKYIRIHQLREPALVLHHGRHILFRNASRSCDNDNDDDENATTTTFQFSHQHRTTIGYYTVLEQVAMAALDGQQFILAECCLAELQKELQLNHHHHHQFQNTEQGNNNTNNDETMNSVMNTSIPLSLTSIRYQLLRGRYYEATGEYDMARQIYSTLLAQNPCNQLASKRLSVMIQSQPQQELAAIESFNDYIVTHASYNDSSVFYQLYRQYQAIGQYTYAIYCLQQVISIMAAIRNADTNKMSLLHCELAECIITSCGCGDGDTPDTMSSSTATQCRREQIQTARKHMALALELNPSSVRAQFGLVVIANRYLLDAVPEKDKVIQSNSAKGSDRTTTHEKEEHAVTLNHEIAISNELIRHGAEQITETTALFCTKRMQSSMQALIKEYTESS